MRTVLGDFHWDEKGLPIDKSFLITQWQGGELKFVYPVGQFPARRDLVWPKPDLVDGVPTARGRARRAPPCVASGK